MQDLRGVTIAQYRILKQLESGGMGIVYKAEDTRLQRNVALKFLPEESLQDQAAKERFIREAQLASALDHVNICTIYEFSKAPDGKLFMVMPYYQGESLAQIIKEGPIKINRVIEISLQIADGLACAHANGIIHRDLKPTNIILTNENQVKILDFGLAKLSGTGPDTSVGESSGTAMYMSPEQIMGEETDTRSDIWAFGVILYEMLNGSPPFQGEYVQTISYSILNDEPQMPLMNGINGEALHMILQKALAKYPADRYATIHELAADLKKIKVMGGDTKENEIKETPETLPRKKMSMHWLVAGLVILIVAAVIWFLWPGSTENETGIITVIPFKEEAPADDNSHFADGIAEELINRLAMIPEIYVRPWEFSRQLRNTNLTPSEIFADLGGRYYLSGKMANKDQIIQLDIQIFDATTQMIIWQNKFQSPYTGIFSLLDEIRTQVIQIVLAENSAQVNQLLTKELTPDAMAYDYYLRGKEKYYQYTAAANEEAIRFYDKALVTDPGFVRARAGLADAFTQKTLRYGAQSSWLDSALQQAILAQKENPGSAEAIKAEGLVYYSRSWIRKSIETNQKSLQINANYVPAMANLGWSWIQAGEMNKALPLMQKAQLLNPTNPSINIGIGYIKLIEGEYDEAEKWLRHAFNLQEDQRPNPLVLFEMLRELRGDTMSVIGNIANSNNDPGLWIAAGNECLVRGKPACALQNYTHALEIDPACWHPFTGINVSTSLGFILWKTGQQQEANVMFSYSEKQNDENIFQGSEWWGVDYDQAAIHAIRGESDESLARLRSAVNKGFRLNRWLEIDPFFENLREKPAFINLLVSVSEKLN